MEISERQNITAVAPFLADDFVELEEDFFDKEKYSEFLNNNKSKLGDFSKYIICKLHDSWVLDIQSNENRFHILLNDFSTYVFSEAIIEKYNLDLDSDKFVFPITIKFEENLIVNYYSVDDEGILNLIEPIKLDEYLYEQITEIDKTHKKVVFEFWKSNLDIDKPGERIIVVVTAKNITLLENQDEAWQRIYGNEYADFYKYFRQQFESGRYVSDLNECLLLISEFEHLKLVN